MYYIVTMDLINLSTIAFVTHFRLKFDTRPVYIAIEECLLPPHMSEQHQSIDMVFFISMCGQSKNFFETMELIDTTTMAWVTDTD